MNYDDSLEPNDFVVRIRPMSSNNSWNGQIDISIITSADNDLDDESYGQMLHLTKMICATVPIMEGDTSLADYISDWVMENIDGEYLDEPDAKSVDITHEDGNVVRLNFGTPTKGRA